MGWLNFKIRVRDVLDIIVLFDSFANGGLEIISRGGLKDGGKKGDLWLPDKVFPHLCSMEYSNIIFNRI